MECRKLVSVLAILSMSSTLALGESLTPIQESHHHHHHASADSGYSRSVASYKTPDVTLIDANGKAISLRDSLDGSGPVMLNFIFTTCTTVCPVMSATFSQVQARLGSNPGKVRMVSISIDPENDTPSILREYAQKFEAGPHWSMLTGSLEDSIAVQRAFDIYRGDKMNHEPVTFMRKGPHRPWLRINGFVSADDLLTEYGKLASN